MNDQNDAYLFRVILNQFAVGNSLGIPTNVVASYLVSVPAEMANANSKDWPEQAAKLIAEDQSYEVYDSNGNTMSPSEVISAYSETAKVSPKFSETFKPVYSENGLKVWKL